MTITVPDKFPDGTYGPFPMPVMVHVENGVATLLPADDHYTHVLVRAGGEVQILSTPVPRARA